MENEKLVNEYLKLNKSLNPIVEKEYENYYSLNKEILNETARIMSEFIAKYGKAGFYAIVRETISALVFRYDCKSDNLNYFFLLKLLEKLVEKEMKEEQLNKKMKTDKQKILVIGKDRYIFRPAHKCRSGIDCSRDCNVCSKCDIEPSQCKVINKYHHRCNRK